MLPQRVEGFACRQTKSNILQRFDPWGIFFRQVSRNAGAAYYIDAFWSRSKITCKSSNLVYLITWKRFDLQYVGETKQPLHIRINGHRSDIWTKKNDKPVAAHFCQPDHCTKDVEVRGIEKIHHGGTLLSHHGQAHCSNLGGNDCYSVALL